MRHRRSERYEAKRLARIARHVHGTKVLDIGHAQYPNPWLDPAGVTGFDRDEAPDCAYARQIRGEADDIGNHLQGSRFTTIIAAELVEHLENPYRFLRALHPLLEPGGRLIVSTPNPVAFPTLLCEWLRLRRFFYSADHTYYFAPRWVERLLNNSGYRLCRIDSVGLWPFTAIPAPVALSYQVIYVAARDKAHSPSKTGTFRQGKGRSAAEGMP